jgi:sialate O-acetylesterase
MMLNERARRLGRAAALAFVVVMWFTASAAAEVRLPKVLGPDMVLQRDKPAPIWGWAAPGEKVTVRFAGQEKSAVADEDGKWTAKLDPMPASVEPRELTVTGTNTLTLRNVVVGDVWLCSGDFGVFWEMFAVIDAEKEVAQAEVPAIRLLKVTSRSSNTPMDDIDGAWRPCTPAGVTGFSALAYYYGRALRRELGVPIGLIDASYRYSATHAWMPPEAFRLSPELEVPRAKMESWDPTTPTGKAAFTQTLDAIEKWLPGAEQAFREGKPIPPQPRFPAPLPANDANYLSLGELSLIYNGMIAPLQPFAIRGCMWSMGESGAMETRKHRHYEIARIESWRNAWGQGDFPVYFELLPSYGNPPEKPGVIDVWTLYREEQIAVVSAPNTGFAVTFDVSDYVADRRNRKDPGERLARVALAKEYGRDVAFSGPVYKGHRVDGDRVIVTFEHAAGGLIAGEKNGLDPLREAKDGKLHGFMIAGEDKQWHWADARIEGESVVVRSDKVPVPAAIRYAYASNPSTSNLYNRAGLPAVPFRTDSW